MSSATGRGRVARRMRVSGGLLDRPAVVGVGERYGAINLKLSPLGGYTLTGLR